MADLPSIKLDLTIGRIRQYADRCDGLLVFSSDKQELMRVSILNKKDTPSDTHILIEFDKTIVERISTYADEDNKKIAAKYINVPFVISANPKTLDIAIEAAELIGILHRFFMVMHLSLNVDYFRSIRDAMTAISRSYNVYRYKGIGTSISNINNIYLINRNKITYEEYRYPFSKDKENTMAYSVKHGYKFDGNSLLTYYITYMSDDTPIAAIKSKVYKGKGNTCINSMQITQDGYDDFSDMIKNATSSDIRNNFLVMMEGHLDVSGGSIKQYIAIMSQLWTTLNITIQDKQNEIIEDIPKFLLAWQSNESTIAPLTSIVSYGLLPVESLSAEQNRLSLMKWERDTNVSGKITILEDTISWTIMVDLGSVANEKQKSLTIKFLANTKTPSEMVMFIMPNDTLLSEIHKYVDGDYGVWVENNVNKDVVISEELSLNDIYSAATRRNSIEQILAKLYSVLEASNIRIDSKIMDGIATSGNIVFNSNLPYLRKILTPNKDSLLAITSGMDYIKEKGLLPMENFVYNKEEVAVGPAANDSVVKEPQSSVDNEIKKAQSIEISQKAVEEIIDAIPEEKGMFSSIFEKAIIGIGSFALFSAIAKKKKIEE